MALLAFVWSLTSLRYSWIWKSLLLINVILIGSTLTPWVVEEIKAQENTWVIHFGILASVYFVMLFTDFVAIISALIQGRKRVKGVQKQQINIILGSLAITLSAILITNALFPFGFGYYGLTNAGSFFTAALVSGVAYSIVRLKLFDIRLVVARSLAYVLSIFVIVTLFVSIVFGVSSIAFNVQIPANQKIYIASMSIVIALVFQPIKALFDKVSNKVFFRNDYNPQEFLNKLSKITASTLNLPSVISESSALMVKDFKVEACSFVLLNPDGTVHSRENSSLSQDLIRQFMHELPKNVRSTILYGEDTTGSRLKQAMTRINAEAIIPLNSSNTRVGYLLLGIKSTGQPFNSQDLKILSIGGDSLAVSIQNALRFEEIQNFATTLQTRVDEATRKLRYANDKLKALDETKDDFISMASHQLRTPLTSIKGYISMVQEGDAGKLNDTQKQMLGQAFTSSQRMVYLIADLLNVSRLKTGKFIIDRTPVNLAEVIEQELAQVRETALSRKLDLIYDKPQNFPDLMLDETKTRQVIMNFVDNAIFYTPAGGQILVRLIDKSSSIELRVEDNGIGISKSDQPHLFTKFYRASNARKARPDGTGLGLFMAKKVIIAEEGSLIFETVEGKGSTFGFSFSKSKAGVQQK